MTKQSKAQFGSISSGTMRPEDLIPDFVYELRQLCGDDADHLKLCAEANAIEDFEIEADIADEVLSDLFDALDSYAPAYGYFGAHPGDGADYGFWLSEVAMEDFDGLKVNDLSEIPDDYVGEVMVINDHGNVTLGVQDKGEFREIWAVV